MQSSHTPTKQAGIVAIWIIIILVIILAVIVFMPRIATSGLKSAKNGAAVVAADNAGANGANIAPVPPPQPEVIHVTVPKAVKAVYMSSWVAGTPSLRDKIVDLADKTEINAVVIDIKDYTGYVSYTPTYSSVIKEGCFDPRIKDIESFIKRLHEKNIYVIGRLAVFQDPCMVKKHPEWAVKTKSTGAVWKDHKGITWMDAGSPDVWKYTVEIARNSYDLGFDEINFDYIRYPSDGNMEDIAFPVSGTRERSETLKEFFKYIDKELRGGRAIGVSKATPTASTATSTPPAPSTTTPPAAPLAKPGARYTIASDPAFDEMVKLYGLDITGVEASAANAKLDGVMVKAPKDKAPRIVTSADLFGFVTTNNHDLGIGQVLEKLSPYVDFIGPMVYPSHYPKNFIGYANPAEHPYAVIQYTMSGGVKKLDAIGLSKYKLRPWLQDFNLGATYGADKVRAQIKATYDVGLTSWMLWDASNTYTPGGALPISSI